MVAEKLTLTPGLQIVRKDAWVPDAVSARLRSFDPRSDLGKLARECALHLPAELAMDLIDRVCRSVIVESSLAVIRRRYDERLGIFVLDDFGVVCRKVITTAGVNWLVTAWQNTVEPETMKYHGIGTGTTAEATSDTALVTELTTEYNPNSTRATGSLATGGSSNVFRSVGTNTLDSGTPAITEHGLFNQAATGGGTLWDRSVFSAINLVGANGDGLQTTYDVTFTAGG